MLLVLVAIRGPVLIASLWDLLV